MAGDAEGVRKAEEAAQEAYATVRALAIKYMELPKVEAAEPWISPSSRPARPKVKGTALASPINWQTLLAAFRLTDRQMSVVTGLLAVASGFAARYLTNAAWGSPKDYLEAFLWGAIVSEGLKVLASLPKKVWPD